jgi:glycosyltransferase involved in cell wall biosynthesis
MISICIPVYNYAVDGLVIELLGQIGRSSIQYEVLVIEDGSTDANLIDRNKRCCEEAFTRHEQLIENIGRNCIRQHLARRATYPYLLFLDADSGIRNEQFLKKYEQVLESASVIAGGRIYPRVQNIAAQYLLHYKHGIEREEHRGVKRHEKFLTCNFLISKELFLSLHFDPNLKGYGYEDSFMLLQFKARGLQVSYIYNPVYHENLTDQEIFLKHQQEALKNLLHLYQQYNRDYDFRWVKLIKVYQKLSSFPLGWVMQKWLSHKEGLFLKMVKKNNSLLYLDLWKLAHFCHLFSQG